MRRYRVVGHVTVSVSTVVEAASEEEARALAEERQMQGLCHQCAEGNDDEEWALAGELDGQAEITRVERL